VIPLRVTALIDAPNGAVRRVLARTDIWTRTARALGGRAEVVGDRAGDRAPLRSGDLLRFRPERSRHGRLTRLIPPRSLQLTIAIVDGLPQFDLLAGPASFCRINITTASTGAGTLVTVDTQLEMSPRLITPLYRRRVLAAGQLLLGIIRLAAAETEVVVAGVIIEDGRLLAARRTHPPALAGKWELPGGKVKPGETEVDALARELAEELGIEVEAGERFGAEVELGDNRVLRCRTARICAGRPAPSEHDQVRWVPAAELDELDWLPADRELLPELRHRLEQI
jgi:8-oxo-dGTP diphosphatase